MRNLLFLFILIGLMAYAVRADPTPFISNLTAQGGNVTLINLDANAQTINEWQGYYGKVSGTVFLKDANNNTFYNWGFANANGEVIASRDIVTDWTVVNCTNQTEIYDEQERLHISNASIASINSTYLNTTHPAFTVAGRTIEGCRSTLTSNLTASHSTFWNIILNANATTTLYSVIMQPGTPGFDGNYTDFQLLVPVDTVTGIAVYNIYVELA